MAVIENAARSIAEMKILQPSASAVFDEEICPICHDLVKENLLMSEGKSERLNCCTKLLCFPCFSKPGANIAICPNCEYSTKLTTYANKMPLLRSHVTSEDGLVTDRIKWAAFQLHIIDESLSEQEKRNLLISFPQI